MAEIDAQPFAFAFKPDTMALALIQLTGLPLPSMSKVRKEMFSATVIFGAQAFFSGSSGMSRTLSARASARVAA